MKSVQQRQEKYAAKNNADAVRIRFADMKVLMDANQASTQQLIFDAQTFVRAELNSYGVAAILSGAYQAIGMKCLGKSNRFSGATLTAEITAVLDAANAVGLNADVLTDIGNYFGVAWTA